MEAVRIVESKNKNRIVAFCNPKMMQQNGFTATTIQESIEFFNAIGNATAFFNSCINEFLLPFFTANTKGQYKEYIPVNLELRQMDNYFLYIIYNI